MESIAGNIAKINQELANKAKLVVVSKTRAISEIQEAYDAGQRVFAENRVQALLERYEVLPKDIEWHLIGHLQTNKVKYIAPFVSMIQSVDSLKLLMEIEKQAAKYERIIPCLLQIYIATEDTKFGLTRAELLSLLESEDFKALQHIRICGIMAMASFTGNENQVKSEFSAAKEIFIAVKKKYFEKDEHFSELSIGMSSDYLLAVKCGSTMVRIGSNVFNIF